jgi:hypothetical protein
MRQIEGRIKPMKFWSGIRTAMVPIECDCGKQYTSSAMPNGDTMLLEKCPECGKEQPALSFGVQQTAADRGVSQAYMWAQVQWLTNVGTSVGVDVVAESYEGWTVGADMINAVVTTRPSTSVAETIERVVLSGLGSYASTTDPHDVLFAVIWRLADVIDAGRLDDVRAVIDDMIASKGGA